MTREELKAGLKRLDLYHDEEGLDQVMSSSSLVITHHDDEEGLDQVMRTNSSSLTRTFYPSVHSMNYEYPLLLNQVL